MTLSRLRDLSLSFVLVFLCGSVALPQEDAVGTPTLSASAVPDDTPRKAFAEVTDDSVLSAEVFRAELATYIVEQSQKDERLTRLEKRRIERVMKGGWFQQGRKNAILDSVTRTLHATGAIVATPEGVQAAIDWENVFKIINEQIIPLIMTLIKLFGG